MREFMNWMIAEGLAKNDFQASAIVNGLKLWDVAENERKERVVLYRKWRPKTDKKNQLPSWQAFELAIAGIDPADVQERQIELDPNRPLEEDEFNGWNDDPGYY
jgi:hypothetical protein